jgi:hypothetical protein
MNKFLSTLNKFLSTLNKTPCSMTNTQGNIIKGDIIKGDIIKERDNIIKCVCNRIKGIGRILSIR